MAQTGQGTPSRFKWRDDFRMNTMDIVVAVLLGIIEAAIEIVGALGFLERTVWADGPCRVRHLRHLQRHDLDPLLRRGLPAQAGGVILFLAIVVTHVVRWFMGDPDGPLLLWYAIFPVSARCSRSTRCAGAAGTRCSR